MLRPHLACHGALHLLLVIGQAGKTAAKAKADTDRALQPVGWTFQGLGITCAGHMCAVLHAVHAAGFSHTIGCIIE